MREVRFDRDDPLLAAVAWARLAEPGDSEAGGLRQREGGPVGALRWLLDATEVTEREAELRARWLVRLPHLDPARELRQLQPRGVRVLIPGDPQWPSALDELGPGAPACLWVLGEPALLARAAEGGVAVVGARASTGYGEHVTGEIVAPLALEGRVVVSGGAYGIDAAAHRVTLAVGGATIAVMAGGLDRFYPAGNTGLLERIAETGAVIAEIGPGSAPTRSRFLVRNRLIAALASGCIVVEAGWRSGTISTANHASALLRPVGAVPGPVTSAASSGCHRLMRLGQAVCVTDAQEVRELIGPLGTDAPGPTDEEVARPHDPPARLTERERRVWEALPARGDARPENVASVAGLTLTEVLGALGVLELGGHVRADAGTYRRTAR